MEGLNQEIEIIIKETGEKEEQLVVSSLHPQRGFAVSARALRQVPFLFQFYGGWETVSKEPFCSSIVMTPWF